MKSKLTNVLQSLANKTYNFCKETKSEDLFALGYSFAMSLNNFAVKRDIYLD